MEEERMDIGNVMSLVIDMMTEEDFWDKFQRKHNPQFYDKFKKSKTQEKKTKKKKTSRSTSAERYPVFKVSD